MNRNLTARLERLEGGGADPAAILIERTLINPDGSPIEPWGFLDDRGNKWLRQPGEPLEAFRVRAGAGALAAAPFGRAARIIPCERRHHESEH